MQLSKCAFLISANYVEHMLSYISIVIKWHIGVPSCNIEPPQWWSGSRALIESVIYGGFDSQSGKTKEF